MPGEPQVMPTNSIDDLGQRIGYVREPASEPRRPGIGLGRGSVRAVTAAAFRKIASLSSPDRRAEEKEILFRSVVAGSGRSL